MTNTSPAPLGTAEKPGEDLFVLSARTEDQLAAYARKVADYLTTPGAREWTLAELCATARTGRREMRERLAVLAEGHDQLAYRLRSFAEHAVGDGVFTGRAGPARQDVDQEHIGALLRDGRMPEAARLWTAGARVDWRWLHPGRARRRAAFPTYPFERRRYWLTRDTTVERAPGAGAVPAEDADAGCVYRRPVWVESPPAVISSAPPGVLLLVSEDPELREAFAAQLAGTDTRLVIAGFGCEFAQVDEASYTFDHRVPRHHRLLAERLTARGLRPDAVVHAPMDTADDRPADRLERALHSCFRLSTALLSDTGGGPLRLVHTHTSPSGGPQPSHAAVAGLLRTLDLEHSRFSGSRVAFEGTGAQSSAANRAERLFAEVELGAAGDAEVRHRDGVRLVKVLEDYTPTPAGDAPVGVRPDGTYLITGGAGALGLVFARHLAEHGPVNLVLAGRSAPSATLGEALDELNAAGCSASYVQADVSDPADVERLCAAVRERHGALHGVLHTAGVTRDARAVHKDGAALDAVLAPKVFGALHLDEATAGDALDFFVLFSSVVAETGNPGQCDYAAANAYLHTFAEERAARCARGERWGRTVAIGWPLWEAGGMTVDGPVRELFAHKWGMTPMPTDAGLRAFHRGLAGAESSFVVVHVTGGDREVVPESQDQGREQEQGLDMGLSAEHLRERAVADLRAMAAGFLLVDEEEVELDADLMELGFDSISLTELINEVNSRYALDLLPTVLFECPDLLAFADYLVENHPADLAGSVAPAAEAGSAGAESATVDAESATVGPTEAEPSPVEPSPVGLTEPEPDTAPGRTAVAVIGMAGVLPGSPDLDAFWEHLAAGADLVGPAPADRAELHAHPDTASVCGGFVEEIGAFDTGLFAISPKEAALMDPQQRLILQAVWRAVEDAGYRPSDLAGTDTGLFAGVSTTDYGDLLSGADTEVQAHTASGVAHSILANRVSHVLDLRGPSEAVDTACSSALVALHRAVRAIAAGDCTAAVVGGVNALLSPGLFTAFTKSGMLSPDAACKTFDKDADGYVRGEGVGAVLLKPLAAAEADGDHIHAVIRGTAVNHGGRSPSLTAPNPEAQAQVLVKAHREAGFPPDTVTAIEAHGTGTRLGDPIEIEGMKKAFRRLYEDWGLAAPEEPHIAIGSVKTNIGHLEAASGIAGLLKILLSLRHGELPPTIHFREVNPYLRLDGTPFRINDRRRTWDGVPGPDGRPLLRAGVSSFGFGGTNAHVVVESYTPPVTATPAPTSEPYLLPLSAPDEAALCGYAHRLAAHLAAHPDLEPARISATLQFGRAPLAQRLCVLAASHEQAVELLRAAAAGERGAAGVLSAEQIDGTGDSLSRTSAGRWASGDDVDWSPLWPDGRPRRLPLPGAPFSRRAHWFDARTTEREVTAEPDVENALSQQPEAPELLSSVPARRRGPKVRLSPPGLTASTQPPRPSTGTAPTPEPAPFAPTAPDPAPHEPVPVTEIAALIREQVAEILAMAPEEIGPDQSFAELGLDSIFRMDLIRAVNARYGLALQIAEIYDQDTVTLLSSFVHDTLSSTATSPHAAAQDTGDDTARLLARLLEYTLDRPIDPKLTFVDNGLTSFDMLRSVSCLERRFGGLRKTLLFDRPTVTELAAHLTEVHGAERVTEALGAEPAEDERARPDGPVRLADGAATPAPASAPASTGAAPGTEPLIVRKKNLDGLPEVRALLDRLDAAHAKEGGLAGRDIAPLAFIGAEREGYFNFSRRDSDVFAWSYVGSEEYFPTLVRAYAEYGRRHGLRVTFLSLLRVTEVSGIAFTATPFGAVQRLESLADFSLSGGRMSRLRYMVQRFKKAGECRTEEYRSGSDPAVDERIAGMISRWGDQKQMVNPYVAIVREELRAGVLAERHRMFLTWLDGELASVVIVTRIPSENGYLLDLEFYPADMPLGGLEFAIVEIITTLAAEGSELFSFGASFGVKVGDSPNADPAIEAGLEELRSAGIFGEGNFRFKNKFRPTNRPIYLCQPADVEQAGVSDVILMIADPDVSADAPGQLDRAATATPVPVRAQPPAPAPAQRTGPAPQSPAAPDSPTSPISTASPDALSRRAALLAAHGHNPVNLPHAEVDIDLITDSWAELETPAVTAAVAAARQGTAARRDAPEQTAPPWLPFDHVVTASSGRSAEAMLCRSWAGRRGVVPHNGLFPTWLFSLLDNGFTPAVVPTRGSGGHPSFAGDLDLAALRGRLREEGDRVSFVCVELSGNAGGGHPVSLANLRRVREATAAHGVPLVLDATRIVENAAFVAAHEDTEQGRGLWEVVRDLLSLADSATFSLSKDFGLDFGGLAVTRDAALGAHLREQVALRGRELGLSQRKLVDAALHDTDGVAARTAERMAAVRALWQGLRDGGAPVAGEAAAGHCVLLDVARMPWFDGFEHAVASCLAWIFHRTGIRGGPHLAESGGPDGTGSLIRLAVPCGFTVAEAEEAAARLVALFRAPSEVPELLAVDAGQAGRVGSGDATVRAALGRYHPAAGVPEDVRRAMREHHVPEDGNVKVLLEANPAIEHAVLELPDGRAEVFSAGAGPVVLLMPPFNIGAGVFARQFAELPGRFRLISVHHPGVGASTGSELTLDAIADRYTAVLDRMGVGGPVHLVGASFGGLVAQTFALAHPERTRSLTLLGSSYKVGNRNGEVNRLATVAAEDFDRLERYAGSERIRRERADLEKLLLRCESMDAQTGLRYLDVFASQATLLERLPDIAVPTLIVQGSHDTVIPLKTAHLLHGAIPDARYAEIPDAGHFPGLTSPAEVHSLFLAFLDEHGGDERGGDEHSRAEHGGAAR
ncbi:alpha/beta fold hydrolase [Streptomyces sp. NPDC058374]|uniref:alpha/beta fold hydrolase n=1 Tax=Streptomyces sp. NPDC058374 TaxID=3346466 RepID=UPI00365C2920